MVELQIVVLAVAGSSPVGHPSPVSNCDCGLRGTGLGTCAAKEQGMLNPDVIDSMKAKSPATNFWLRILRDEELSACDDLQKLVAGCEIIAALDAVDLLAA